MQNIWQCISHSSGSPAECWGLFLDKDLVQIHPCLAADFDYFVWDLSPRPRGLKGVNLILLSHEWLQQCSKYCSSHLLPLVYYLTCADWILKASYNISGSLNIAYDGWQPNAKIKFPLECALLVPEGIHLTTEQYATAVYTKPSTLPLSISIPTMGVTGKTDLSA